MSTDYQAIFTNFSEVCENAQNLIWQSGDLEIWRSRNLALDHPH